MYNHRKPILTKKKAGKTSASCRNPLRYPTFVGRADGADSAGSIYRFVLVDAPSAKR
jgi:hypothetical protein